MLLTGNGIVAGTVVEGSMMKEMFMEFLEYTVVSVLHVVAFDMISFLQLPKCSAYPRPLSVLVMDNVKIHHGPEILELVDHFDASLYCLLPSYSFIYRCLH